MSKKDEQPARSRAGLGARFLYHVVQNESMKTDPPEVYGWRVFALACSACFGGMLFGMDIGTIGGVLILPAFTKSVSILLAVLVSCLVSRMQNSNSNLTRFRKYGLDGLNKVALANLTANIASTLQAGCFLGCFLASWVADKSGRRTSLIMNGIITVIGCIFQAAGEGKLAVMYIGRYGVVFQFTE
jgi:MFS family permease